MSDIEYTPPPTCAKLIVSEKPYNFIVGPVGSGKTSAILFKILYHAQRQQRSPVDGIRRTRFCVIRNTNRMLTDTTLKSWFTWFKPGVAGRWEETKRTFTFEFGDVHCEVLFRPLDRPEDVSNVLSLELTGAILDEFVEMPREVVDAVQSRCGRYPSRKDGGCTWSGMWGASNPGNEDSWWFDWLYDVWPGDLDGSIKAGELAYFEQPSGFSPLAENLENLPPYDTSNTYYMDLSKGKTPEWVKQYIEVRWGFSIRGRPVFKMFNNDVHVARSPLLFNPHLPLVVGFDAGLTPAAICGQMTPHGQVVVLRELTSENMGAKRFCREKLQPLLGNEFPGLAELIVCADPAVNQRAQTDEVSVRQILEQELQVKVHPAYSNTLSDRIDAVETYLTRLTEAGPAYIVDPSCKVLIRGFTSGYRYPENAKGVVSSAPEKNSYSHPHDANQYMCMAFMRPLPSSPLAGKRKPLPAFKNRYSLGANK